MRTRCCFILIALWCALCLPDAARAKRYQPMPEALDALESDNCVSVSRACVLGWLRPVYRFAPRSQSAETGFIIYPGGLIDYRSYAPTARAIAQQGVAVFLVPMPLDLAVLATNRASRIIAKYRGIDTWIIGGHSHGGVMACRYAREHTAVVDGVVLWAAYPSDMFRLDSTDLQVLSIYGTNDGLTTLDEIEQSEEHLPADAEFVEIEGGNHTYFGWYGEGDELQTDDNPADISRQEQQDIIVQQTAVFLCRW